MYIVDVFKSYFSSCIYPNILENKQTNIYYLVSLKKTESTMLLLFAMNKSHFYAIKAEYAGGNSFPVPYKLI